jgi:serine/threonine protein kinase
VIHRDVKPENLLVDKNGRIVVSDFGVAHFEEEDLATAVETGSAERLANFRYSAPEQRTPGAPVDERADIFAMGLILHEMFTGEIPHGTGYRRIGSHAPDFAYLDPIVEKMIRQSPSERPPWIAQVKDELIMRGAEFITHQKLDAARKVVVPSATPRILLEGWT